MSNKGSVTAPEKQEPLASQKPRRRRLGALFAALATSLGAGVVAGLVSVVAMGLLLMGMKRTNGVGRHTSVIPEAPGLEPWGVVTFVCRDSNAARIVRRLCAQNASPRPQPSQPSTSLSHKNPGLFFLSRFVIVAYTTV